MRVCLGPVVQCDRMERGIAVRAYSATHAPDLCAYRLTANLQRLPTARPDGVLCMQHRDRSRLNQEVSKLRRSVKEAVGEKLLPLYMWDAGREAPKVIPIAGQPGMVIWEE